MSIFLNPNCSELIIRVDCSRIKALQILFKNGVSPAQLVKYNVLFEECEKGFMCRDCNYDAFKIMHKIAVLFNGEVESYDGGHVGSYEEWLEGSEVSSTIEEYYETACRKLDDFLFYG